LERDATKLHNLLDLMLAQSQHVIVLIRAERRIDPRVKFTKPNRGHKRTGRGFGNPGANEQPMYVAEVEVNCDECGGSGYDPGSLDPWGPEVCPVCHGAKTQTITRNYLAEAFQIASNPDSLRPIERLHLVAIIQHCRQAVSALMSLPEVPEHRDSVALGRRAKSSRLSDKPRWRRIPGRHRGLSQKEKK
jgi:hypothetical protein